jgi:hypothetical protein
LIDDFQDLSSLAGRARGPVRGPPGNRRPAPDNLRPTSPDRAVGRTVSTNARFRWEYLPGSELFLVYNEDRNTLVQDRSSVSGRSFIVKMNRLFRF